MMKIHAWIEDTISSHGIFDHAALAADFNTRTGFVAGWPSYTAAQMAQQIEARGVGGSVNLSDPQKLMANGWEIAAWLCDTHAKNHAHEQYFGRGRVFDAAVRALVAADL